jgi:hypothetical protein
MDHAPIVVAGVMFLVALILLWVAFQRIRAKGHQATGRSTLVIGNLYPKLRNSAFDRSAHEAGAAPCAATPHVFGVIVELVLNPETNPMVMTLASFVDGATSLYFDTGNAVVGGGGIAAVAAASKKLVSEAERHLAHMRPSDARPRPEKGVVRYFFRTFDGTLSGKEDITYGTDGAPVSVGPLSVLLSAADDVITQLRVNSPQAEAGTRGRCGNALPSLWIRVISPQAEAGTRGASRNEVASENRQTQEIKCVLHGAELISWQIEYFPDWRAAMLREFDNIEPNLPRYFEIARELSGLKPSERTVRARALLFPNSPNEYAER